MTPRASRSLAQNTPSGSSPALRRTSWSPMPRPARTVCPAESSTSKEASGHFRDGALRPLEAVRHLAYRRRASHEGQPTAADVQQVPRCKVTAGVVVNGNRTVPGLVGQPVHQDGGHAAFAQASRGAR